MYLVISSILNINLDNHDIEETGFVVPLFEPMDHVSNACTIP